MIDPMIHCLAACVERLEELRQRLTRALCYPTLSLTLLLLSAAATTIFIVPGFDQVFAEFDVDLPTPTVALIETSRFTAAHWPLMVGFAALFNIWRLPAFAAMVRRRQAALLSNALHSRSNSLRTTIVSVFAVLLWGSILTALFLPILNIMNHFAEHGA